MTLASAGVPAPVRPARDAMTPTQATAFAPASVGNIGVGFDLLGHTITGPGDRARVTRIDEPVVRITAIEGDVIGTTQLPLEAERNTAGRAHRPSNEPRGGPCWAPFSACCSAGSSAFPVASIHAPRRIPPHSSSPIPTAKVTWPPTATRPEPRESIASRVMTTRC